MQSHRDKPRAADGVLNHSQLAGSQIAVRHNGRRIIKVQRKRYVIVGRIERWGIRNVKHVQTELDVDALGGCDVFEERKVSSFLEWAAEKVTPIVAEGGFKCVASSSNRIAQRNTALTRLE